MSADNWTYCPKCQPEGQLEDHELYGEHLLREDYEQGMSRDGQYEVVYRCSCRECGFHWEYRHKEQVHHPKPAHNPSCEV